jgi:hypothetical protein
MRGPIQIYSVSVKRAKINVWFGPKCKLTLSVYWAKGRGATAKGRGRDHVNGSTSRKWSGRPLVGCMVFGGFVIG